MCMYRFIHRETQSIPRISVRSRNTMRYVDAIGKVPVSKIRMQLLSSVFVLLTSKSTRQSWNHCQRVEYQTRWMFAFISDFLLFINIAIFAVIAAATDTLELEHWSANNITNRVVCMINYLIISINTKMQLISTVKQQI